MAVWKTTLIIRSVKMMILMYKMNKQKHTKEDCNAVLLKFYQEFISKREKRALNVRKKGRGRKA